MSLQYRAYTNQYDKDRSIVEFLEGQERDHYHHIINKQRFETLVRDLSDGEFRNKISMLLGQTISEIENVEAIIAATIPQLPSEEVINQIMNDIQEERKAEKRKGKK